jgi:hypothetical protein
MVGGGGMLLVAGLVFVGLRTPAGSEKVKIKDIKGVEKEL